MRSVLALVMQRRVHAITACAVCLALSLIVFPLHYVSGALVGLATLRNGSFEGGVVLIASMVLAGAFLFVAIDTARPAAILALLTWVPAWLLASVLRSSGSQGQALAAGGLVMMVAVLAIFALFGDPAGWWREMLVEILDLLPGVSADLDPFVDRMAPLMTGIVAAGTLVGIAVTLLLARWWHAVLDQPGGFGEEFRALRLPAALAWATPVLAAAAWALADGAAGRLAFAWLLIALTLFALQGLALVHALVKRRGASVGWLAALYVALFIMPQPSGAVALALVLAGLSDTWLDYRARAGGAGSGGPPPAKT